MSPYEEIGSWLGGRLTRWRHLTTGKTHFEIEAFGYIISL